MKDIELTHDAYRLPPLPSTYTCWILLVPFGYIMNAVENEVQPPTNESPVHLEDHCYVSQLTTTIYPKKVHHLTCIT